MSSFDERQAQREAYAASLQAGAVGFYKTPHQLWAIFPESIHVPIHELHSEWEEFTSWISENPFLFGIPLGFIIPTLMPAWINWTTGTVLAYEGYRNPQSWLARFGFGYGIGELTRASTDYVFRRGAPGALRDVVDAVRGARGTIENVGRGIQTLRRAPGIGFALTPWAPWTGISDPVINFLLMPWSPHTGIPAW